MKVMIVDPTKLRITETEITNDVLLLLQAGLTEQLIGPLVGDGIMPICIARPIQINKPRWMLSGFRDHPIIGVGVFYGKTPSGNVDCPYSLESIYIRINWEVLMSNKPEDAMGRG